MIFLLFFLAFALSSAIPIQDIQRTVYSASQKVGSLRHTVGSPSKPESFDNESNESRNLVRMFLRSRGSFPSRIRSVHDIHNGSDAVAESIAVTLRGSDQYSLQSTRSYMLQKGKAHGVRNPESLAETVLRRGNQIKLVHPKTHSYILPAAVAVVRMREFFDAVAWEATHYWPGIREQSALFTVTQGPFQLTISCLGGTVPWPVLASAARRFSLLTIHLFVYTFDAYYMDIDTSMTVAFSLRLLKTHLLEPTKALQTLPKALHRRRTPAEEISVWSKRTPALSNHPARLSMTKFRTFTAMIPTALLVAKLEDFYNIIALKIETGEFTQWAPAKIRILLLWDFELTFSCDKMDVPWSFVQAFAMDMAEMSSKSFTGFYEATIRGEGPLTGLVIFVKMGLRVAPRKK